ncbi:MAG TPA: CoA-binding protein [Candidatus Saccharimonadales bacterium]|nr:CoA-binding protein [Candidatus Saccharimonadales bacterium]
MTKRDLTPLFKPKNVAIIGASADPGKVGHIILLNYLNEGYPGKIYLVNKNTAPILGRKVYGSVLEIKERLDSVVIAIPAAAVPEVLEECGKAKVRSVVLVSGGFSEVGNVELQDQITAMAKKYDIALVGPNCLGIMNPRSRVNTLFLPAYKLSKPRIGGVSFIAQSGAVGSVILDLIEGEGFGLSKFVSYGNAADVDEVDLMEYLMNDDETNVIVMYTEGIKRGKAFLELARKITKAKPVVILKAGRTEAGASAAHSHTAALAGSYESHEAVFKQFGFTIANDLTDLLYYAKIFESEKAPQGNRIAIITNGGGAGVLTTDAISSSKYLRLAELSEASKKALSKTMPLLVNIRNPLDLAGDAGDKRYHDALYPIINDPNVDMVIVIILFQTPGADSKLAAEIIGLKEIMAKPMITIATGTQYTEMHKVMMESSGLPVYDSPRAAAMALEALFRYYAYKNHKE